MGIKRETGLITTAEIQMMVDEGKSRDTIINWLQEEKGMTWGSAKNLYYETIKGMSDDTTMLDTYKASLVRTNLARLETIVENTMSGNTGEKMVALKAIDQINKLIGAYNGNSVTIAQQNKDGDGQIIQIRFGE